MQSGSTIQHNRMFLDNFLKNIPDFRLQLFHHLLGILYIVRSSVGHQLFHYERFKQLYGHLFRKTTLINLQFRTYHDNGTARIIHTFSQKILTETAGLSFQHVRKRFQRPVSGACNRTAPASIINQSIHCFLEHTFLIPDNDIRCAQFQKTFQTIVPVDNSPVQIVQVRCGKTASVQLDHGAQIRRNYRNHRHNHPFRPVAGTSERFHNFQSFDNSGPFLSCRLFQTSAQFVGFFLQINTF